MVSNVVASNVVAFLEKTIRERRTLIRDRMSLNRCFFRYINVV